MGAWFAKRKVLCSQVAKHLPPQISPNVLLTDEDCLPDFNKIKKATRFTKMQQGPGAGSGRLELVFFLLVCCLEAKGLGSHPIF